MRHASRLGALVVAATLALGCRAEASSPSYATRDSAGVHIVESARPAWTAEAAWMGDSVPALTIGTVGGAPELSFAGVSAVSRLPDGSLVVADGVSREIRIFDRAGGFVGKLGRRGSGPGEFQGTVTTGVSEDSIWAVDVASRRLTFLDPTTGAFRIRSIQGILPSAAVVGRRADGSFVFATTLLFDPARGDVPPQGFYRPNAAYVRVGADGAALDTLLIGKGQESIVKIGAQTIEVIRPLFSRNASRAVRGDELIYGDQGSYEVRVHAPDGTLRTIVRRTDVDLTLTEAAYQAAVERMVSAQPEEARPGMRTFYASQDRPEVRPAYGRLLTGPDGELWVQDYSVDGGATGWSVFDAAGVWLGTVEVPVRFRPLQIGRDEMLGVWRDDLDVEYVRAYRLRRGRAG
jgi:hypothetical protein